MFIWNTLQDNFHDDMMKLIARPVPTPREHVSGHYAKPPASGQFKLSEL